MTGPLRLFDLRLILTIICFAIAVSCLFGLVLRDDPVGRYLFATTWVAVGLWWLSRYLGTSRPSSPKED